MSGSDSAASNSELVATLKKMGQHVTALSVAYRNRLHRT